MLVVLTDTTQLSKPVCSDANNNPFHQNHKGDLAFE